MEQETGTVDENIRLFVPGLEHQAGCFRISDDDLAHDSQGKDNEDAGNRDCMIQNAENENVGAGAHLSCAKSGDESVEINVLDAPKGDLQFSGGSAEFFLKKRNTEDEGQDTEEDEDGRPRTWSNDSGPIRRTLRTIDKYVSPGVDTMIDRASSVLETSTTFFVGRGDEGNDSENSGGDEDASMVDKLRAENAELRANTTVVTNERDEMKKLNHALKLTLDDLTKAHEENRSRLAKLDDLERRIRVVENENEHLGSINDKLQQSMREMHDEAVVLEAEASKVTQMNRDEEELKQKIEELEKQNTDARVFAETSQQQNSALQEEINRVKQANKATTWDFESKIKDLESQVFEMSSENRRLTEDKDELESKLKIQTEKGSTQAELTQKLLKSEQQNVATLEQKLENALSQLSLLESSSNDVQVQLRTEISKLESQNSDYEAQISRMRETFGAEDAEKSKTVEQLRGEIVGLQEQNQLLELSKLKSDRNAKNIEANVLALDTKLTQSTAVQDELSGTVRHLQDQIEQHRKEQLDWEQTERDLEKKVSRLQEQIFRQTDDNSKEFGREQSLVDENASLTHETSELKLSVNTLEQRCSGQQLEISQLNAALLEMRSQRDAARDERKDLVELSSQIDSLKHESEQNRILKETNKDLSEQLITMTKLHQESVRAGGAYTEQLEEVQADYVRDTERLIETVRKHEGTISNLNSDIAKLKVHVEEIELRERKTLKSEQASQEQCDILRQQLESVQRELDETISGLKHEATLLEGVTKAEETLHARILQLESDLKAQKTTTDTLREEVRLKDEAIYSLKKKNAAVESKYESETVSLRDEVSQGNVQLARETQKLETALKQAKALGNDQEQEYKRTIAALEKRIARLNIELEEKGIEARKLKARQWDVQSDNTNSCDLQHKVKQTLREKDMLYLELTNLKNKLKSEVAKVKTECQHDFDRKLCQVESSYEQAEAELQYRLQQLEQKSKADSESSTKLRVRNIELEHEIRHLLSNRNYPVEGKSSQKQVTVDDSARAKRLFDQLRKMTENTLKLEQMHALEIERLHAQLQKERGWYTNLISSEREENQTLRTNISKKAKSPPVPPVLDKPGNSKHLAGFLALLLMHLGRVDRGKQVAVAFAKLRQYSPALEVAEPVSLLRPLTPKRTMLFRYKYLVNCIIRWKRSRDRNYLGWCFRRLQSA